MSRRRRNRGENRARFWLALFKTSILLGAVGASGYYSYEVGRQLSLDEIAAQQQELSRLAAEARTSREETTALRLELETAKSEAATFRQRYEEVALTDEMKDLITLIKVKMSAGIDAKRVALAIGAADRPRNCQKADSKRFMVKTPRYDGANTWVRFNDAITVSADGAQETAEGGQTHDWFDPAKDVTVHFTMLGGKESTVSGKLPLHHSVVVKNAEYRFTLEPGARGFIEVTGDRCDYRG